MADSDAADSKAVGVSAVSFVNDSASGEKSLTLVDGESTVRAYMSGRDVRGARREVTCSKSAQPISHKSYDWGPAACSEPLKKYISIH